MNDAELDALVAGAVRPSRERVAAVVASAPLRGLREEILAASPGVATTGVPAGTEPMDDPDDEAADVIDVAATGRAGQDKGRRRRRTRRAAVLVAAGVACVVVAAAVGFGRGGGGEGLDDTEAWSPEALEVAAEVPTVLLPGSHWRVTEAVGISPEQGELRFRSADAPQGPGGEAELHWRPAADHESYVADREASSTGPGEVVEVTGLEGVLFQYDSPTPDSTVLWLDGDHSLELRAPIPLEEMRSLARSLVAVDANTWLGALPPEVVRADGRPAAVAAMVADIPLPPGFDLRSLQDGQLPGDRYDLGVEVTQAVTCAWIREWEDAATTGDTGRADAAEAALATAPDWSILHEMNREGDWPEYVWEWALAGAAGTGSTPYGEPIGTFCTNR